MLFCIFASYTNMRLGKFSTLVQPVAITIRDDSVPFWHVSIITHNAMHLSNFLQFFFAAEVIAYVMEKYFAIFCAFAFLNQKYN